MPVTSGNTTTPEILEERLNELATSWMLQGPAALTESSMADLSRIAAEDARCEAFAARARALSQQLRTAAAGLTEEPFTELRKLLPTHVEEVPLPAPAPAATGEPVFAEDPEMLEGFVMEAEEHLDAIEEQILALEKDPSLMDKIHAVFRAFHTMKGLAGFLGLSKVQAVAHEVETLLDHARNSRVRISSDIVDLVLASAEYLRKETAYVQARLNGTGVAPTASNASLLKMVADITRKALQSDGDEALPPTPAAAVEAIVLEDIPLPVPAPAHTPSPVAAATEQPTAPQLVAQAPAAAERPSAPRTEATSSSIRIDTAKLDQLMDLVGEMVIAQSILNHNPFFQQAGNARLTGDMSKLARITGEVQKRAMSMRMMPIGPLFQKNAKLVRDLSRRHGKQVNLVLSGEATELDKTIAEELSDPLLHMIRNALDHGIETPEERIASGKPPMAQLRLSAEHQSGKIVISISDDGRGLDPARILGKAVQNGLVEAGVQMPENEIFQLIFAPGFSTAEKITDISGRGVGMDVVRQHVEKLRGEIKIESKLTRGTTFYIHLPLTLAIIEGLVVAVGTHHYVIPIFSIREMFRPTPEMISTVQGREEMVLMRNELLPLIRLHKRFGIEPRNEDVCEGLLVVCEAGNRQFCIFVDDLLGCQEIVIKSLDSTFSAVAGVSGCAILGDGQIGLILDAGAIFRMNNTQQRKLGVA